MTELANQSPGMSQKMLTDIERLETIASWMGKPGATMDGVVKQIIANYSAGKTLMSRPRALRLYMEARDFLMMGVKSSRDAAAGKYLARLEWLLRVVGDHIVTDEVENTSMGPAPVASKQGEGAPQPGGRTLKVKVKPKVLSVSASQLALKIMKEIAIVTGGRSGAGPVTFNLTQNNLNMPGARETTKMTNEGLASYLTGAVSPEVDRLPILDGTFTEDPPIPTGDGDGEPASPGA